MRRQNASGRRRDWPSEEARVSAVLIELTGVRVTLGGKVVLRDIDWQLREGEHWVVTGPNGAGKSTFLRVVRGDQRVDAETGKRTYRICTDDDDVGTARSRIGFLSPELQERLLRMQLPLSARELIAGGIDGTLYLASPPSREQQGKVDALASALGIESILERTPGELSFGQFRRVLLARALVADPKVLVLDEFAHGIDRSTRATLNATLEGAAAGGTSLVVSAHRLQDLPASLGFELRIERG